MAIYDRHYVRDAPPPRGFGGGVGGGIAAWSVTTWLIIICVAVFIIDHPAILPMRLIATKNLYPEELKDYDPQVLTTLPRIGPPPMPDISRISGEWSPVVETATGRHVGWREVMVMPFLQSYLHFSTELGFLQIQYWRFIGFQFLHGGLGHLVFNMIGLFFFGPMIEEHLGRKRFLAFYLLCGIFGACFYLLLNLGGHVVAEILKAPVVIPGLLFNDTYTPLVGASAGVFGVLMAGAYLAPRATVLLFFILPLQLRTLAYLLVAFALYSVITGGYNAGGEAGHLGGALAGFYFIRRPHHLHGFFDFLGWVDPTSHHYRHKQRTANANVLRRVPGPRRSDEVDRILAKISAQGLHSLTDQEKRILREASKRE